MEKKKKKRWELFFPMWTVFSSFASCRICFFFSFHTTSQKQKKRVKEVFLFRLVFLFSVVKQPKQQQSEKEVIVD